MARISTNNGFQLKTLFLTLFLTLSIFGYSQNDCMGTESYLVNPPPNGGGYAPGTVVEFCVTYNNWNTGFNTNWLEGFDITIGPGWAVNTITPTTYPPDNSGTGQWIWIPGTFNGNINSSGGAGNQFGPGFFYDYNNNGQTVDDWGDNSFGPWSFCFEITVGNTVGASLSLQVSPVSDGFAGSWTFNGCNGYNQLELSPNTTVLGCLTPPVVSLVSVTDATCSGFNDGSINVTVNQGTAPYTFYLDGVPTVFPVNNLPTGPYVITCTDDESCNSNVLNVNVGENTPVVNNTINLVDNVCFGESNGSFEITSVGGQTPYSYTLNGVSQPNGVYSNLSSGNYLIIISDDNGCTYNHNVTVTEPTDITHQPVITTDLLCFNDNNGTITVNVNGGTAPYLYECNGVVNNTGLFNNLPANIYSVLVTDDNGCQHIIPNITIFGPNQPLQGNLSMTQPTCHGFLDGTVTSNILGGTPPYSYIWTVPPPNNLPNLNGVGIGNYTVTVSDANLCDITLQIQVTQPSLITLNGSNFEEVCFGYPVNLLVSQQNAISPYNIVWSNPFDLTQYPNNSDVIPPNSGLYTATLTDANGCQRTHNMNVIVNPLPDPSFAESDVTGCHPKCIDFQIINPQPNYTYNWSIGEPSTFDGVNLTNCYDKDGIFTLKVIATSNKGCVDSLIKSDHIIINKTPIASFSTLGENVTDILTPEFDFFNLSQDGEIYKWNFADGDSSWSENPTHRYIGSGKYCVQLITTSNYDTGIPSCSDTTVNCVTVLPLSALYIPNSFTPNNDDINDNFKVSATRINEFYIMIFNRWNEVLFQSYDYECYWDGNYNGNPLPSGVYYYEVVYRDVTNKFNQQKGTITLLK